MAILLAAMSGILFGIGLAISGMLDPRKIIGFLDLFGSWDPSLAFVMAGAIPVALAGFTLGRARTAPIAAASFQMPTRSDIDRDLIVGAVLFGAGWGIAGFCPGPALASLGLFNSGALVFVFAMLIGMVAFDIVQRRRAAA
jgi:uncharacterized membrane protein YedE/YeeE